MIKLQVLRYMGILTVMKLSVFAISALSLLIALTWVLVYCPVDIIKGAVVQQQQYQPNPKNRMSIDEYFDHYESELDEDMKRLEKEAGVVNPQNNVANARGKSVKTMSKKARAKDQGMIPYNLYTDKAFDDMIEQLNTRDIQGYEFLAESTNVTIYRQPKGDAGLYKYKLYATLPDATPEEIMAVFLDNEYRLAWDGYVTDLYPVQLNEKGPDVIYFNVDYPWPLANRDYVYTRESRRTIRDAKEYFTIVMHSVLIDNIPQVKNVIRVDDYHQSLALTKWGKHGSTAYIEYYDNPKGSIPSWLVNWAAKTGVPAFLKDLQRACGGLQDFLKKHHKQMLNIPVH